MTRSFSVAYGARHRRLNRTRGPAAVNICTECGEQAREWAQIHDTDGTDIWNDYVPLCAPCHRRYDGTHFTRGHVVKEEWREAARQAQLGRKATPETRDKLSRAHRGVPLSEEHRAAISKGKQKTEHRWCQDCQKAWHPAVWPRHIRKYHEGGAW